MKAIAAALVAGVIMLGACDLITGSDGSFSVWTDDEQLVLRNGLDEVVRYWAVEAETSQLALIKVEWASLRPGEEERVPYEDLIGYTPDAEQANVYWSTESEGLQEYIAVDL